MLAEDTLRTYFSAKLMLSALGYGLICALFLGVCYFGVVYCRSIEASYGWLYIVVGIPPIVLALFAIFIPRFIEQLSGRKMFVAGYVVSLVSLLLMAFLPVRNYAVELVLLLVYCTGICIFFIRWTKITPPIAHEVGPLYLAVAFVVFACALILIAAQEEAMRIFMCCALLLLSGVCLVFQSSEDVAPQEQELSVSNREDEDKVPPLQVKSAISYMITAIGLEFFVLYSRNQVGFFDSYVYLGLGLVCAGGVGFLFFYLGKSGMLLLGPTERMTLPLLVFALLLAPHMSGVLKNVLVFCLLVLLLLRDYSRIITRRGLSYEYRCSTAWFYGRTLIPFVSGLFLGSAHYFVLDAILGSYMEVVFCSLFIFYLVVAMSIAPMGADPLTSPFKLVEEKVLSIVRGNISAWQQAIDKLSKESALTPREKDVLVYLARGRSASVVARELTISVYTVKSHSSNIYRKIGADSQQALIDLIEDESSQIHKNRKTMASD